MAEQIEAIDTAPAEEMAASSPAAPDEAQPSSASDFDGLLEEFDRATSAKRTSASVSDDTGSTIDDLFSQYAIDQAVTAERQRLGAEFEHVRALESMAMRGEMEALRAGSAEMQAKAEQLQNAYNEMVVSRLREAGETLANKLVAETAQEYPELPKELVKAFYDSRADTDGRFRALFDDLVREKTFNLASVAMNPNTKEQFLEAVSRENPALSPEHKMALYAQWVIKAQGVERAFDQYHKAVRRDLHRTVTSMIDRPVTEDREAVVAAVRGASTKVPPERPVNLGQLSNAEFKRWAREHVGFDVNV